MRTCVILNPNAGSADDIHALQAAIQRLDDPQLYTTEHPNDAQRFAHQALERGCELVIAAGGDGTVNEVVNGLSNNWQQAALGIIPLGTGNDFVRTIDVPGDLDGAIGVLLANKQRDLDVVCVESDKTRYFINVSAGGFSGLVDEKLTDNIKEAWGPLSYLRSAAAALPELTDYHTLVSFDDGEPTDMRIYNMVIANARFVAGGIPIAPRAEIDDGLVDVLMIPAESLPRLALLMPQIMLGTHLDSDIITFRRARNVRVDSRPPMWFNADGEVVGSQPSTFHVLPRALRVIVGPGHLDAAPSE